MTQPIMFRGHAYTPEQFEAQFGPVRKAAPAQAQQPSAAWVNARITETLTGFAGEVGRQVRRLVDEQVAALTERANAAEAELALLRGQVAGDKHEIAELRKGMPKYIGTANEHDTFSANQMVTHGGSLWICLEDTSSRPPGAAWRLAVKKGRDGKAEPRS